MNLIVLLNPQTAYVDPSVMTYAIQAIAGIVIAVGAVVMLLWHKAKKKVLKTLNMEEKSKKETEEDVVITDDKDK